MYIKGENYHGINWDLVNRIKNVRSFIEDKELFELRKRQIETVSVKKESNEKK